MMCLPTLVMKSRQLSDISKSTMSTNIAIKLSTSLKHFIKWCSLALMKDRLRTISTILLRWLISSSSLTSWVSTVISFLRFRRSSSRAFYSSSIFDLVLRPRARLIGISGLASSSYLFCSYWATWSYSSLKAFSAYFYSRFLISLVNIPKLRYSSLMPVWCELSLLWSFRVGTFI